MGRQRSSRGTGGTRKNLGRNKRRRSAAQNLAQDGRRAAPDLTGGGRGSESNARKGKKTQQYRRPPAAPP